MELFAASAIVMLAAILHACTGFGFSVLATPFLLLVYDTSDAIQINIALSILISLFLMPKLVADVDKPLLGRLILGSLLGAPVGIVIYVYANPDQLRAAIGVLLLVFSVLVLRKLRFARSRRRDLMTGGFSGALTAGLGMPGPPLMVYFAGTTLTPSVLRSTTLVCFLVTYSISLILQIVVGSSSLEVLKAALFLTPATAAGVVIGQLLFRRLDPAGFMKLIHGLLIVTGAYLVIGAVMAG